MLLATSESAEQQGDSDSTAIVLNVAVQSFELLLGIFYNPFVFLAIA
jgi:hypothetical protein